MMPTHMLCRKQILFEAGIARGYRIATSKGEKNDAEFSPRIFFLSSQRKSSAMIVKEKIWHPVISFEKNCVNCKALRFTAKKEKN